MVNPSIQHVGIVRSYAREREIVHENDPADCVYEVISGTVCTSKMLREGRRQVTGFYFPGDVFGLESAEKHSVAAQAITNAQLRVFKKQALTAVASSNREVAASGSRHADRSSAAPGIRPQQVRLPGAVHLRVSRRISPSYRSYSAKTKAAQPGQTQTGNHHSAK
jgi:CRP-like cAMP-binding protein